VRSEVDRAIVGVSSLVVQGDADGQSGREHRRFAVADTFREPISGGPMVVGHGPFGVETLGPQGS
jgi:hypothetical protein